MEYYESLLFITMLCIFRNLINMWEIMIGDKQLAKIIFEHLLEVIALTLPYQEKEFGGTVTRTETHTPKAVSRALVSKLVSNSVVYGPNFLNK